jgi:pyruvate dehydrogenase E2 component (dihydrolipoamide acetyltransferase)
MTSEIAVAIAITVPRLGWSMEEGTFVAWLRRDGDLIKPGEFLFSLESEKATEEIETLDGGILCIPPDAPKPGDKVQVGQLLGYLLAEGENAPVTRKEQATAAATVEAAPPASPSVRRLAQGLAVDIAQVSGSGTAGRITEDDVRRRSQPAAASSGPGFSGRPKLAISPRARRAARALGVDWSRLHGSGRSGRIRERDVQAAAAMGKAGGRLLPLTTIRRTIAARMVAGVTQAAPVTLTTRVDATNLVNLRHQFKTAAAPDGVPSYTDLMVKLAAAALTQHPLLQAQWRDDGLFIPDRIDIAIAVQTDTGLLVPVVRQADQRTLRQVAAQTRGLITLARAGRLGTDQMRDATFTITNLGAFGIDAFTPIIHLPQSSVLGVGRIAREPAVLDDRIVPRDTVTLSLTFDHRILDGAPAAAFLATLRGCVEQPAPWLMP